MRHFLKMKLLLLMALLLAGYGSMWGQSAVHPASWYEQFTYSWTDASNVTHSGVSITEKATDARQIVALLTEIYTNRYIPGPQQTLWDSNGAPQTISQSTKAGEGYNYWTPYSVYYGPVAGGWGIGVPYQWNGTTTSNGKLRFNDTTLRGQYRPYENGYTLLLVDVKDDAPQSGVSPTGNSGYTTITSRAQLIDYISNNLNSVQLMSGGLRVAEGTDKAGTIFTISGTYSKFYFIGKGKGRFIWDIGSDSTEARNAAHAPFEKMFEEFSPQSTSGSSTADFYEKMMNGETYSVVHDCLSVLELGHEFAMGGQKAMSGLVLYIPDNRLKNVYTPYNNYNTTYAPITAMYTIKLSGEAVDGTPNDGQYTVNLGWVSSLNTITNSNVNQHYRIYVVNEDGTRTLIAEKYGEVTYTYDVPQQSSSYTITYVVSGTPVDANGNDAWEETWSNEVTVLIPGTNPDEKFTLKLVDYYSDFDVDNQRNKYINKLSLSEDIAYGLKAGNLREGANNFDFHRAGGGDDRVFARLTLTSTGSFNTEPTLALSTPAAIVGEGSTTVTVRGWNLTPGSSVTVTASNGFSVSPSTLTVGSDGSLTATVTVTADGTQASGTVTVTSTTDNQTATANVTWSEQPQVTVDAPTFTPPAGNYQAAQSVTIASATSGATIYYSTTTALTADNYSTAGTVYSSAIAVGEGTTTIYAIAVYDGVCSSPASATYNITPASTDDVYTLVTDASTLEDGDEILIVYPSSTTAGIAMGATPSGSSYYRGGADVTIDGNTITVPTSNTAVSRFTLQSSGDTTYPWYFYSTTNTSGYLQCYYNYVSYYSYDTYLATVATAGTDSRSSISISNGSATIQFYATGTFASYYADTYLGYSTTNSRFQMFSSAETLRIYKKGSSVTPTVPDAPTFNPDGGSFSSATDVTITGPTGSTINWTFTPTEGTATSGSDTSPVTVNISASGMLSATATVSGSTSNATTATYTVTSGGGATQVFTYDATTALALPTGWTASSARYYNNEIVISARGYIQSPNYTFSTGKATVVFTAEGTGGTMTVSSSQGSSSVTMPGSYTLTEYTVVLDVASSDYIKFTGPSSYTSYIQEITIYDGDLTASRFAPRRAAGAAAVQRAAASSITVTPTWTYVTDASENPEYLQIDASKTTTFKGTAQTYTNAEAVINVMDMFASGSYFYDQFAASTAENNHPDSYTYYLRFAEAVGVGDSEGITSNDVTVPVYKANSKIGGSYTKAECDADTLHAHDVSDAIDASIQVQNKSEIYYYELTRRLSADGATDVVGSYQRMANGDYRDMATLETYDMPATAANLWIDKTDTDIQAGQEAFYVPTAVTLHRFGETVNGSTPELNNYGGPITPAFLGSVDMRLTNFYGAANAWNTNAQWTYNDKTYCYYNVELTVWPDETLEIKDGNDTYELYKYRVWRELAAGDYNEPDTDHQYRNKGDYLFDEVNIREEQNVWSSANRGTYPDWTTAGRTLNGAGLDDNGNGPEASGTFGGRLATSQADPLNVTFRARLYYRSKSVDNTQSGSKAPRMAGASDEGGNYYYIVEKILPAEIYRDENHTAVDGVTVAKEVESVKFYNVAGMESDKPFEGVNIVVTRYTDGTTSSQKVLK